MSNQIKVDIKMGFSLGSSKWETAWFWGIIWLAVFCIPLGIVFIVWDILSFETMDAYSKFQEMRGFSLTKIGTLLIVIPPVFIFTQRMMIKAALEEEAKKKKSGKHE